MLLTAEGFCFSRFVHLIILFSILCIEKEAAMLRGRGGRSPVQSVSYSFVCVKWGPQFIFTAFNLQLVLEKAKLKPTAGKFSNGDPANSHVIFEKWEFTSQ